MVKDKVNLTIAIKYKDAYVLSTNIFTLDLGLF